MQVGTKALPMIFQTFNNLATFPPEAMKIVGGCTHFFTQAGLHVMTADVHQLTAQ